MQYQEDILFDELKEVVPDELEFNSDILDKFESFTAEITGRKYQAVSTDEVVVQQDHLTGEQKRLLQSVLDKHTILFDGKLGCYTGNEVYLKLIDNFTLS